MKKTLIILMMVLLCAMLIISCANEPKVYDVTFDLNGGSGTVEPQSIEAGAKATKPADPTRNGFSFLGWYADNVKFEFETTEIKADITLKAKWGVTVTFNTDGGSDVASVVVEENKTLTKPTNPTKTGLIFNYWTKDGTTEFNLSTPLTESITLKALWRNYYIVGDIGPAGGIIFYDCDADNNDGTTGGKGADGLTSTECNWRYLEISATNLSEEIDGSTVTKFIFGYCRDSENGTNVNGVDTIESAIGKGSSNTTTLVSKMGTDAYSSSSGSDKTSNYAAKLCDDYKVTYNGKEYADWFLPSENELKAAYTNLKSVPGMTFGNDYYWTSTVYSTEDAVGLYAYAVGFGGYRGSASETVRGGDACKIRPVRAFK